ncbi:MAG: heme exporter protein CcmD [Spongiibacteraceae bacterium]|jgi:heme exporter protein D|nr:heme exporter protein CcmD [Spongiibacteraceae bacterium]
MYFESWQAVWTMGGHGPYVWAAYTIWFVTLSALVWLPLRRQRRFLAQQAQIERRRAARSS